MRVGFHRSMAFWSTLWGGRTTTSHGSRPGLVTNPSTMTATFAAASSAADEGGQQQQQTSSWEVTATGATAVQSDLSPSARRLQRVRAGLWSYLAGDALSAPTHWYYGGFPQIQSHYGRAGITGYTKPVWNLPGSILNKSNLSGGGRSSTSGRRTGQPKDPPTIIGHVINHGKQDLWSPSQQIHYHATLQAGECTLEAQLGRVLMRSITATGGRFDADHFRQAYMDFMMTPGSHNDTYASTCHRMFFANYIYGKLPPKDCPDNDQHNVDTVDGLVLPTVVALTVAARPDGTAAEAAQQSAACAAVTRRSAVLERAAAAWGQLVFVTVRQDEAVAESSNVVEDAARQVAAALRLRTPRGDRRDEMTACYLSDALPALLDSVVKYASPKSSSSVWQALLANANTGGENVHRGSCLGAVLGANSDVPLERPLVEGLYDRTTLEREVEDFLQAVSQA